MMKRKKNLVVMIMMVIAAVVGIFSLGAANYKVSIGAFAVDAVLGFIFIIRKRTKRNCNKGRLPYVLIVFAALWIAIIAIFMPIIWLKVALIYVMIGAIGLALWRIYKQRSKHEAIDVGLVRRTVAKKEKEERKIPKKEAKELFGDMF